MKYYIMKDTIMKYYITKHNIKQYHIVLPEGCLSIKPTVANIIKTVMYRIQ